MVSRITRQYRRFFFASLIFTAMMALACLLGLAEFPANLMHPVIGPLSWIILLILVIGLPLAAFTLILPGFLPLIEVWLATFLLLAGLTPALRAAALPAWVDCVAIMGLFIVVERITYGPWLSQFWRRDMRPDTAHITLPGTPEEIWPRLCPTPEQIQAFYWPGATILPAPKTSEADFILSLPRRGGAKDDLAAVTIEESTYPSHFRYTAAPMAGSPTPMTNIDIRLAMLDDGRSRLTYTQSFHDVPFGQRLFFYLGHNFRDTLASMRARLSGRRDWSLQGAQMVKHP